MFNEQDSLLRGATGKQLIFFLVGITAAYFPRGRNQYASRLCQAVGPEEPADCGLRESVEADASVVKP